MKILVLPSFYPDPSNRNLGSFFRDQVKTFVEFGIKVDVIYVEQKSLRKLSPRNLLINRFQTSIDKESRWTEYKVKGWNIPGGFGKKIWVFLTEKLIRKYILENGKPDLIHVQNVFWAGLAAYNISKKLKIPFVVNEHSCAFLQRKLSQDEKAIAMEIYSKASRVIVVSKSLEKAIKEINEELKIEVVPNIVDTDFFVPVKHKSADGSGIIKFLTIGNLNKNKGHDLLVDAFAAVSRVCQNAVLEICGDGPEKKQLQKKIDFLKLKNKVNLSGHLEADKILKKLQEADCLVHTSYLETFGIVLIEAMACGLPVITTKSGGPEDILEEGAGYLVEVGNIEGLTEAMLKFVNHKENFSSAYLRSLVITKFSRKVVFQKFMSTFSKAQLRSEKLGDN